MLCQVCTQLTPPPIWPRYPVYRLSRIWPSIQHPRSHLIESDRIGLRLSVRCASQTNAAGGDDGDDWAFTPTSKLPDAERFRGVEPLKMTCRACHQQADFQGVFAWDRKKPVNSPADLRVRWEAPGRKRGGWGLGGHKYEN